jgi:4-diphosphocytidyl-2-C-methyl-D-erythritol kinase
MISFPNCKINLGLNVLSKREDGFHDLETVFYPVYGITDALEVITDYTLSANDIVCSGLSIQDDPANNLCLRAWHLLKADFRNLPYVRMHLHKVIPAGAGLAGGSSDGVFALQLLNKKFQLNLTANDLLKYAEKLGSDCSFFVINKPSFATGRGEILNPVQLDLSAYNLLLVNPGIHINTGRAFSQITPALPAKSIQQIIQQPIHTWREELVNDFEQPVFAAHPEIAGIKDLLYQNNALYAAMSGSGSTVFGIFEKTISPGFTFPASYFVKTVAL